MTLMWSLFSLGKDMRRKVCGAKENNKILHYSFDNNGYMNFCFLNQNYLPRISAGLTLTVVSISAAETARDYNYNRYPNQRFVYTLGPNIYAGTYVVFASLICGFIYIIFRVSTRPIPSNFSNGTVIRTRNHAIHSTRNFHRGTWEP